MRPSLAGLDGLNLENEERFLKRLDVFLNYRTPQEGIEHQFADLARAARAISKALMGGFARLRNPGFSGDDIVLLKKVSFLRTCIVERDNLFLCRRAGEMFLVRKSPRPHGFRAPWERRGYRG